MPKESKTKAFLQDAFPPKRKRGRPRRAVALEKLCPFEKCEVASVTTLKSLEKEISPLETKPESRRLNPTTCDRNYTSDEVEFMNALAEFKRASGRTFPTCSEILGVLRELGYAKISRRACSALTEPQS